MSKGGSEAVQEFSMTAEAAADTLDTSTLPTALMAFRDGDFSVRLPVDHTGIAGKISDTLNSKRT
jgi:hypothetical protein